MQEVAIESLPSSIPRKTKKKVPADVLIFLVEDTHPITIPISDTKDWAIIFEDVLEVRSSEATYYWPLDQVRSWKVVEHGSERT